MALRRKLKLTRVGVIEAISIAAGVATLASAAQNIMSNNPRISQSKIGHLMGFKEKRQSECDAKMLSVSPAKQANLSDQQFSALLYQESALLSNLPPLLQQLHTDIGALEQLRKEEKSAEISPLIKAAKNVVVRDKQAIVELMIQDHVQLSEIIRPRRETPLRQVVPSGS
jgi:hypothetical protein